MLKNEHGHYLNNNELMDLFGYPRGGHWPPQGFTKTVNGVSFWCKPKPDSGGFKSSKHRLFYWCEKCSPREWVPCGRACQHKHNWERKKPKCVTQMESSTGKNPQKTSSEESIGS